MITALDTVLTVLHDRGILNEIAFEEVCAELLDDQPLTRDHLSRIFGVAEIFHLLTIPDATARQLVQEAADALFNPDSTVNLKDWLHAAQTLVGPITFGPTPARIENSSSSSPHVEPDPRD